MKRAKVLTIGALATLAATALWHGPGGAAEQFSSRVERKVRGMLDHYEMNAVTARLHRGPLARRIVLGGPADDFQRREIKRMTETLPGVAAADWTDGPRQRAVPMLVEAMLAALAAFAAGVILAYVAELRRRARAL